MYRTVAAVLATLALAGGAWAQDGDKKPGKDKYVLNVKGKIDKDDPLYKDKVPHKAFKITLDKGSYTIEMRGKKGFDSIVLVESSGGKILGADDDGGGKDSDNPLDAKLVFKAPKKDEYRIIAASLNKEPGEFTLQVRPTRAEDDPFFKILNKPAAELTGVFSINGETKKLSDLKGKVVVLDFWAVWCGPCIRTFPELRAWDKEFKKDGLEIVGVTTYYKAFSFDKEKGQLRRLQDKQLTQEEENAMLKDFVAHHKLPYRIMAVSQDGWKDAGRDYGIQGIPHVVVLDRKGMVRMVRVGASDENAEAIREEVRKLLAEKK
jgi:thiol-disulfide isomerase/thioredoxin